MLISFLLFPHPSTTTSSSPSESMILLGSIERAQLQALLSLQLGRPRRLEYIRERAMAEKKRLSVVSNSGSEDGGQRVSQEVRFQVREEMWWHSIYWRFGYSVGTSKWIRSKRRRFNLIRVRKKHLKG